jgi:hypothetical protein
LAELLTKIFLFGEIFRNQKNLTAQVLIRGTELIGGVDVADCA